MRPVTVVAIAATVLSAVVGCAWRSSLEPRSASVLEGVPPTPLVPPEQLPEFVGSDACHACHQEIHASHAASPHARTLARVQDSPFLTAFRTTQRLEDPSLGVTYSWRLEGKRPICVVQIAGDSEPLSLSPRYAVGSGKIGTTFVFERNGTFMEGRTSYYPGEKRWHWTPGQDEENPARAPSGKPLGPTTAAACFLCHSTALAYDGQRLLPEQSIFNVGCERCHGPGRSHIEAVARRQGLGRIYGYRNASADRIMKLCDECHRAPVQLTEAELARFPNLPRFAGPALALSECYRRSDGKLSCLSCHDPHARASSDLASYERVCKSCHTPEQAHSTVCPVRRDSGCIDCHMPARPVDFPIGVRFRTHWIKVYRDMQP